MSEMTPAGILKNLLQVLRKPRGANPQIPTGLFDTSAKGRMKPDASFLTLAGDSAAFVATENDILGCSGVVAVEIGCGEGLDHMQVQKHGSLLFVF